MKIMVKGKVIILGFTLIVGFLILNWALKDVVGFEIEFLSSPYGYILIILTGMLIAVSSFLPYMWGKIVREMALFCLFIFILLIELNIIKPFVKATKIDMEVCKSYFVPSTSGEIVYDALKYASCILTGYFPVEEGDIGWTVFYLFYIILPFAFIWALLYGLMNSVMSGWFNVGFNINALLSFIIAMYAARTLMGGFLLNFAGYGAWGLGAIFLAVLFTKSIDKIMEDWYKVEQMAQETKQIIESGLQREKAFAESIMPIINIVKELGKNKDTLETAKTRLNYIRKHPIWETFDQTTQNIIEWYLQRIMVTKSPEEFLARVKEFEDYLNKIKGKVS